MTTSVVCPGLGATPKVSETALCIFVKPPLSGRVKTRLCPPLSHDAAARLAAAFFEDTFRLALQASPPWSRVVVACDGDPEPLGLSPEVDVWPQGRGDLGVRMERVLRRALQQHDAAAVMGTDVPGLPLSILREAHAHLQRHDAALGPTLDGGFFLLGLRRCPRELLRGVAWSQATTRQETLQRLRSTGLEAQQTKPWFDVDLPQDLARLREALRQGYDAASTARVISSMRGCFESVSGRGSACLPELESYHG